MNHTSADENRQMAARSARDKIERAIPTEVQIRGWIREEIEKQSKSDYSRIPDGYNIITNSVMLMLVKSDQIGKNPGVHAVCPIADGVRELLRRFYEQQKY